MEKALMRMCILLTCGLLLCVVPTSQAFLKCFKCNLESEPNCVDRYPPDNDEKEESERLVDCHSYDTGCIIYEYQLPQNGSQPSERMGGQRCFCKAEQECLGKQGIKLEEDKFANVTISWKAYQQCMDNFNKIPGEADETLRRRRRRRRNPQNPTEDKEAETKGSGVGDKPQTRDGDPPKDLTQLRIFYCQDDGCNRSKKGSGAVATMLPIGVMKPVIMISMLVSLQSHFTLF